MKLTVVVKRIFIFCLLIIWFLPAWVLSVSYADDAQVLPKGVFRANVIYNFYFPIDQRYNPDGDTENLAVDFNTSLNSNVFPLLSPFDPVVGGSASIGDSIVSFEYDLADLILSFQYGITDRFTVGVIVPYYWNENEVSATLDSSPTSSANVGINAAFACGAPLCPLFVPGTNPLTTEDVQMLLGGGLDVDGDGTIDASGFGFKRFESWSDSRIADIEAGFRAQYFETEQWRLAMSGGARFPTGKVDDPDNLVDIGFGEGAYALLFRSNNDYSGIPNLVLNGTLRYDLVLPDRQTRRVPVDVNRPITTNKDNVKRDLGDRFEFEGSGRYTLLTGFDITLLYQYKFKLKDQISGSKPFAYESLEDETRRTSHTFITGISYTTVPLYLEKKFPVPLTGSISYENWFAGSDNVIRQQFLSFSVTSFF